MTTDISTLLNNVAAAKQRLEDTLLHNADAIFKDSVSRNSNIAMTVYPYVDAPDAEVKINISTSDGVSLITIKEMDIDRYTVKYNGTAPIEDILDERMVIEMLLYLAEYRYSHIDLQCPPRDTPLGLTSPEVEAAKKVLEEAGYIGVYWHKMDVEGRADELGVSLTQDEVYDIVHSLARQHDCEIGLNWDVIDTHIADYSEDWAGIDSDDNG